jgi:GTP-binding protein
MKIKTAVFETGALAASSYPPKPLPEFAFIGRSNVGKSSLLNMLTGVKGLAKASATPGRTRMVNFFRVNDAWRFVDLPGYGYDAGPKTDRAEFHEATREYLARRPTLACVFVLIDSRLPPQRIDIEFLAWLTSCSVRWMIAFTKTDKEPGKVKARVAAFVERLQIERLDVPEIFLTSAETRAGRLEILRAIDQILASAPDRQI